MTERERRALAAAEWLRARPEMTQTAAAAVFYLDDQSLISKAVAVLRFAPEMISEIEAGRVGLVGAYEDARSLQMIARARAGRGARRRV